MSRSRLRESACGFIETRLAFTHFVQRSLLKLQHLLFANRASVCSAEVAFGKRGSCSIVCEEDFEDA